MSAFSGRGDLNHLHEKEGGAYWAVRRPRMTKEKRKGRHHCKNGQRQNIFEEARKQVWDLRLKLQNQEGKEGQSWRWPVAAYCWYWAIVEEPCVELPLEQRVDGDDANHTSPDQKHCCGSRFPIRTKWHQRWERNEKQKGIFSSRYNRSVRIDVIFGWILYENKCRDSQRYTTMTFNARNILYFMKTNAVTTRASIPGHHIQQWLLTPAIFDMFRRYRP